LNEGQKRAEKAECDWQKKWNVDGVLLIFGEIEQSQERVVEECLFG
jgi:hypothetical protein